ncbi:hypothetical protein [Mariniluteicoccus flavus]
MADPITRYQDGLVAITDEAEADIARWADQVADGTITEAEYERLVRQLSERAAARAASWAELCAAATVTRHTRTDALPLGNRPNLPTVATKATTDLDQMAARLRRTVYDTASQTWTKQVFARRSGVRYWTRRAEGSTKCPVCTGLANGHVLRADTPMKRHAGCRCVQAPASKPNTHTEE